MLFALTPSSEGTDAPAPTAVVAATTATTPNIAIHANGRRASVRTVTPLVGPVNRPSVRWLPPKSARRPYRTCRRLSPRDAPVVVSRHGFGGLPEVPVEHLLPGLAGR